MSARGCASTRCSRASPRRRAVAVAGLALDSRAVAPRRRLRRLRRHARTGSSFAARRLARGARAVLWDPGEGAAPALRMRMCRRRRCAQLRDRLGGIADRFYGAPSRGSPSPASPAPTARPPAPGCSRRRSSALGAARRLPRHARRRLPAAVAARRSRRPTSHAASPAARARDAGAPPSRWRCPRTRSTRRRVDGVRFDVAVFTNLTPRPPRLPRRHGALRRGQGAPVPRCPGSSMRVLNCGDPVGARLRARARRRRRADRGRASAASVPAAARFVHVWRVIRLRTRARVEIRGHFGARRLRSPLIGGFNAENLAVTLGVLLAWDSTCDDALAALARLRGAAGPHGTLSAARTARSRWSTTRTRPTRSPRRWRRCARTARGRVLVRVRLRRRARSRQAPADGRGGRAARRPRHRHRRQSARRGRRRASSR